MNAKARQELIGIGALVVGLFLGLTLLRLPVTGNWGDHIGSLMWRTLGAGSAVLPLLGIGWALAAFQRLGSLSSGRTAALGVGLVLLLPYGIGTVTGARFPSDYALWSPTQRLVGVAPALVAHGIHQAVGTAGGALVGLFALSALGILTVGWHPLVALRTRETGIGKRETEKAKPKPKPVENEPPQPALSSTFPVSRFPKDRKQKSAPVPKLAQVPAGVLIPPIDLLTPAPPEDGEAGLVQIEQMGRKLIETLQTFRVEGSIAGRTVGPVVTQYEVAPGPGVKVGRIAALADDLALAMRAPSLRIVAPIPGKAAVGIEVPNKTRETVYLKENLADETFTKAKSKLTLALGKDISGNPVCVDLAKMPHLLVAGTTGSGKSVALNAMILSLLYKSELRHVRLILVDPKMLELSVYQHIPHLLTPVVTDMKQAVNALGWCVAEMDRRYKLMNWLGVRNLSGFNHKVAEAEKHGRTLEDPLTLESGNPQPLQHLPYIVVVIDELADLMMVVGKKVEELIARLAQKARAAGVHLVLATQRPSVDVITGLIKANIPTRVAFQVSSKVDSRTILDQSGAEALLGAGDMLYLPPGSGLPQRVHGAFVADHEVHKVVSHLRALAAPEYLADVLEPAAWDEGGAAGGNGEPTGERDPLYDQAVEIVLRTRRPSISLVQRHLRIGYNRAARLIEDMERSGMVSPMQSNGNREVLVPAKAE